MSFRSTSTTAADAVARYMCAKDKCCMDFQPMRTASEMASRQDRLLKVVLQIDVTLQPDRHPQQQRTNRLVVLSSPLYQTLHTPKRRSIAKQMQLRTITYQ